MYVCKCMCVYVCKYVCVCVYGIRVREDVKIKQLQIVTNFCGILLISLLYHKKTYFTN